MSETSSINTLIGTFSSINNITSRAIDPSNLICIDTQNNRIGVNTIDPSYSISIVDNISTLTTPNISIGIYTPRLYFDVTKLPTLRADASFGQVYIDGSNEILKVKLPP